MAMRTIYELKPVYDSKKSFNGKAYVEKVKEGNCETYFLYSYDTIVMKIESVGVFDYITLNESVENELLFSSTTLRHIKELISQVKGERTTLTKSDLKKGLGTIYGK